MRRQSEKGGGRWRRRAALGWIYVLTFDLSRERVFNWDACSFSATLASHRDWCSYLDVASGAWWSSPLQLTEEEGQIIMPLCKDFPRWLCFPSWKFYTFSGIMVSVTLSMKCEMIWRRRIIAVDSVGRWEEGASLFMACCSRWWVKMPGEDHRTSHNQILKFICQMTCFVMGNDF